ncbi:MAG: UDP-N-acetylglucosamine 2-epimerase [Candidatus Hermodarchaeota archaeon]|nr:UDP-N-acetylglucosamine 2-epimerase [Candidatus Hermodarchaeota archaeon]
MRRFKKITKSEKGKRVFNYRGMDLLSQFQTDFEYYFKVYLPLMVQYYKLSLQIFKKEKPDLVLMENEYVGFERALIYACHKRRVPSLAQQHGVIHEDHPGYLYTKEDISTQEYTKHPFCPLASITSVIGPSFKKVLTDVSAYPESKVAISGQPRYDVFYFTDRIYDKSAFLKRFNLDPKKKIVLLATQPFPLERLRHEFFTNTLNNLRSIEGIQIVVKPHPNEAIQWFTDQLASVKTTVVVLPPFFDTIEAIYASDVFLSVNSTTIIEALILNKPVVVVNLSKQTEPLPWVEEGAALGVYEAKSIQRTVENALYDEKVRKKLDAKRTDFVHKHLYKIDGKATERVIDLIQKLAK